MDACLAMDVDALFSRPPWPHQRYGVEETISELSVGVPSLCLTSPTGSGKTAMAIALARWMAEDHGGRVLVLTNRILLTEQTRRVFQEDDVTVGVISASMKWAERELAQVQIATIQTILARRRGDEHYWIPADLLLVDEIHQCASGESAALITEYHNRCKTKICGLTASPLGVSNVCHRLIVAAGTRDLQDQGILCYASWFAPSELDTRQLVKGKVDLSLSENDARRTWGPLRGGDKVRTRIVGNILQHYRRLHPELTHTLAFAPGVKESLWAAQFCQSMGIRAMHVDGDDFWVDDKLWDRKQDDQRFQKAMDEWRNGYIQILWNRFVLREGIDEPQIKCILLATPIGSFRSAVQMVGRGLRKYPGKESCLVIDYGGNWWRHFAPQGFNSNVDWESVFQCADPEVISKNRIAEQREKGEPMGQVCPNCGMVHKAFTKLVVCQYCGHELKRGKPSRPILQADGTLTEVSGEPIKQWKIHEAPGDRDLWRGLYFNALKNKKGFSFAELDQQFFYKKAVQAGTNGKPAFWKAYHPPRTMPLMPKNRNDWWRKVENVERDALIREQETAGAPY